MKRIAFNKTVEGTGVDHTGAAGHARGVADLTAVLIVLMSGLLSGAAMAQQLPGAKLQSKVGASASASSDTIEATRPSTPQVSPAPTRDASHWPPATVRPVERDTYDQPNLPYHKPAS
jgi:hypothetical protein